MIKAEDLVYEAEREEFEIYGGICDECWDKEHSEFEIYDWGDDDE